MADKWNKWNKCDDCGQFIPFADIANCAAIRVLLEPDSDLGVEKWETLCWRHNYHSPTHSVECSTNSGTVT